MKTLLNAYLAVLLIFFSAVYCARADDFQTLDGTVYKKVTIDRIEPDCLIVVTDNGVERVPFTNLSPELQKKYGYDAQKAAAYLAAKEQQDRVLQQPTPNVLQNQVKATAVQPQGFETPPPSASVTGKTAKSPNEVDHVDSSPVAVPANDYAELAQKYWPLASVIVVLIVLTNVVKNFKRRARRKRLIAEAKEYIAYVQSSNSPPTVSTGLILKNGESAYFDAPSSLYETRAVRHYQSGRASFRIAKGVWIGGSQGRSVSSQEWSKIDSGRFTITSKRIVL